MDPKSLEEIFNTRGHELTDDELEQLITFYRAERVRIMQQEAEGKRITKAKNPSPSAAAKAAPPASAAIASILGDI